MAGYECMPMRTVQAAFPTILVVANDPKLLQFLDMALKLEFECEVLSVTRGRSAVETAESVKPDLFIMDYHLLDLGARDLSQRLHRIKELESIPTILLNSFVTSWSEPQQYHAIFLSMPLVLADLYAAVNESLGCT
jgi:response regulator RpfG family c-di-GMP phosphodiesterase